MQPETFEPRLLQVKGKRPVRVFEVPMTGDSVNEGDVFIADTGDKLFFWLGPKANPRERIQAMKVGNSFKSRRHKLEISTSTDSAEDEEAFWKAIGGRPAAIKPAVPDDDHVPAAFKFFNLKSDGTSLTATEITERPLQASMLTSDDCYLLQVDSQVYWWTGKESEQYEQKEAKQWVNTTYKGHSIARVFEGVEDALFKSHFVGFNVPKKIDYSKPKEEREQQELDFEAVWEAKEKKYVPLFKNEDITDLKVY